MSTIVRNLVNLYKFLEKKLVSFDDMVKYDFYGRNVSIASVGVKVIYDKRGNVNVVLLGKKDEEKIPLYPKTRTKNPLPLPLCDFAKNYTGEKYYDAVKKCIENAFDDNAPECIKVWVSCLDTIREKLMDDENIPSDAYVGFYYADSDNPWTALTALPEVRDYIGKDEFEVYHKWFGDVNKKKPELDNFINRKWYDVVDDNELSYDEVYRIHNKITGLSTRAQSFGAQLISYNTDENDASDIAASDKGGQCFNYPMSIKHGEMMDNALKWVVSANHRKAGSKDKFEKTFIFSIGEKEYLWFPNTENENGEMCDDFDVWIEKAERMTTLFECLLNGELPADIKVDADGRVVSSEEIPTDWLTDYGINLYEISPNNARINVIERPFSIEHLIRKVSAYQQETERFNGEANHLDRLKKAFATAVGNGDELEGYKKPIFKHLWKAYHKNVVFDGKPAPTGFMHILRRYVVVSGNDIKTKTILPIMVELRREAKKIEVEQLPAYKIGRWVSSISSRQHVAKLPTTFEGKNLVAVYYGKMNVGVEINKYLTLDEDKKKLRAKEYAKKMVVRETKYYTPKTQFGVSLHALVNYYYGENKQSYGAFMGWLHETAKDFADFESIATIDDKNAFLYAILEHKRELFTKKKQKCLDKNL